MEHILKILWTLNVMPSLQEFGSDAHSAIRTVSLALRHMMAQAAASQAFRDHSEEDVQVVQQCRAKEAALKCAQSTE